MKKTFTLLMIVCLAISVPVGMVGCGQQAADTSSTMPEDPDGVNLSEEDMAGEAEIGMDSGDDEPEEE